MSTSDADLDAEIKGYINSVTHIHKFTKFIVPITPYIKARAALLMSLVREISAHAAFLPHGFVMAALLEPPSILPVKVSLMTDIIKEYKPGWLRRHTLGKTRGIAELEKFVATLPHEGVLREQDIDGILKLLQARQSRLDNSLNVSRSVDGSTTQVYKKIAVILLNYWVTSFSDKSLLMEANHAANLPPQAHR